jgi:hypothetical protein
MRFIDRNPAVGRLLNWSSAMLAVQPGLPMLGGTVLVVVSCIATGIVIPVIVSSSDEISSIWYLLCIPALILHLGIFVGFLGFMLSAPLGKGYRETK